MSQVFGAELRKQIEERKQRILESISERSARIARGETDEDDCFMSINSNQKALSECDLKLNILDGDGCEDFDAVVDENGEEVSVYWFDNKWGKETCVARGIFASSINALLKKTGWTQKKIRVPVWVKFQSGGSGMCGVYTGYYRVCRWHTNMVTGEYVGYPA